MFAHIQNLWDKKISVKSDNYQFDNYFMMSRFISMTASGFLPAKRLNQTMSRLPRWAVGCLMYHLVPKGHVPRIDYIRKPEDKNPKSKKDLIDKLMSYFNCGKLHAEQMLIIFENCGKNPYELFGVEKK